MLGTITIFKFGPPMYGRAMRAPFEFGDGVYYLKFGDTLWRALLREPYGRAMRAPTALAELAPTNVLTPTGCTGELCEPHCR